SSSARSSGVVRDHASNASAAASTAAFACSTDASGASAITCSVAGLTTSYVPEPSTSSPPMTSRYCRSDIVHTSLDPRPGPWPAGGTPLGADLREGTGRVGGPG